MQRAAIDSGVVGEAAAVQQMIPLGAPGALLAGMAEPVVGVTVWVGRGVCSKGSQAGLLS